MADMKCPVCGYDRSRNPFRAPSLARIARTSTVFDRSEMVVRPKAEWDRLQAELASLRQELNSLRQERNRPQSRPAAQKSSPSPAPRPSSPVQPSAENRWRLKNDAILGREAAWYPEVVTVPSKLGGRPVTRLGPFALYNQSSIRRVIIAEGITALEAYSLGENPKLEAVELPSTLKTIERYAFWKNPLLHSVAISEGLERIDDCAFWYCKSLTEISLPDSLQKLGRQCFCYCENLRTVTFSRYWRGREAEIQAAGIDISKVRFRP